MHSGSVDQIQQLIASGVVIKLIAMLDDERANTVLLNEVIFSLANMTDKASDEQMLYLVTMVL